MTIPVYVIPASGSLVDIDATILIQLGIFLLLFILLRFLLFKPIIRLMEARHQATAVRRTQAEALETEANEINQDIAKRLREIRSSASKDRLFLEDQAQKARRELTLKTREECFKLAEDARRSMEAQAERTKIELHKEINTVAGAVAEKVLGRPV